MTSVVTTCNLYRTYDEMEDNWESLQSLLRYYTNYNPTIYKYSMPGSFNDPDQVTRELVIYYAIDNTKLHALQIASYSVGVEWHITCYQCVMCRGARRGIIISKPNSLYEFYNIL